LAATFEIAAADEVGRWDGTLVPVEEPSTASLPDSRAEASRIESEIIRPLRRSCAAANW